jgi:membrane protease YdiL (CAAX protease family)
MSRAHANREAGTAVAIGLLAPVLAGLVWGLLITLNLRSKGAPWAVPVMALVLFAGWRWLGGAGWPRSSAAWRREHVRAGAPGPRIWPLALAAGVATAAGLAGLWGLASRISVFPPNRLPDASGLSPALWIPLMAMGSIVAPLAEEAGFRGYAQRALERRFGAFAAIGATSLLFALAHVQHGLYLGKQLVYGLAGVSWGVMAFATSSIWPGIVAHAIADVVFFVALWPRDGAYPPFAWDAGALALLALTVGGGALATWSLVRLAHSRRRSEPA